MKPLSFKDTPVIEDGKYRATVSKWERTDSGGILITLTLKSHCEGEFPYHAPGGPDRTGTAIRQFFAPTERATRYLRVMLTNVCNTSAWVSKHFDMPIEQVLGDCLGKGVCVHLEDGKVKDWGSWNYFEYLD